MKPLRLKLKNHVCEIGVSHRWQSDWTQNLRSLAPNKTLFVVTQAGIRKRHGQTLARALRGFSLHWIMIPDGERHKNLKTVENVLNTLAKLGAHRGSLVVAFGGGVVGDVAGFAASIYMRGIAYVQIPTTLLAQVDSSVGGKTGVDAAFGKNAIGAFHQPRAVFINTAFLSTLPQREFACGMAEVIKAALISSLSFCRFLLKNAKAIQDRSPEILTEVIASALRVKIGIVTRDPFETGERAKLNYGHTLGHAIETLTAYKTFKHGEAVAMGLVFAAHLADRLELTRGSTHEQVVHLLHAFDLPTAWPPFDRADYQKVLKRDKKGDAATIRFILPEKLGKVIIKPLRIEDIIRWL